MNDFQYSQLDASTRLGMVRQRLRDLETSHMQISLRLDTPAPNEISTPQDRENLQTITNSINDLHALEQELVGQSSSAS